MSGVAVSEPLDVHAYLREHEDKELVRFVTVGSVDDGKSTLIGRLLFEAHGIYEDQLAAVVAATRKKQADEEIDYSLFTDGLKAEREQGITIDVAYRYFSTKKRKFIIADTPGHVEYTRNMATGASTADIAVILLDARLGVLPQSRRHAAITSLLGIRQLVVCVNKMDLVGFDEGAYRSLERSFSAFLSGLRFEGVHFVPVSAKLGDNVVSRSARAPWYDGPSLLGLLETLPVTARNERAPLRFPVQLVLRPHLDYRGFAGTIAQGTVRVGDEVEVLPSGRRTRVEAIDTFDGSLTHASGPLSVTLRLSDEVDVSRGDMIVHAPRDGDADGARPMVAQEIEATIVWLAERAFDPSRRLFVKHTTKLVPARIAEVIGKLSLETLSLEAGAEIGLNDIARVRVRAARPLFCDPYVESRGTGAFILVDALDNGTVAAGLVVSGRAAPRRADGFVSASERAERLGHRSLVARLERPLGADVERRLFDRGVLSLTLDGSDLGGDVLVEVARRAVDAGLCVLVLGGDDVLFTDLARDLGAERVLDLVRAQAPEDASRAIAERVLAAEVVLGGGI